MHNILPLEIFTDIARRVVSAANDEGMQEQRQRLRLVCRAWNEHINHKDVFMTLREVSERHATGGLSALTHYDADRLRTPAFAGAALRSWDPRTPPAYRHAMEAIVARHPRLCSRCPRPAEVEAPVRHPVRDGLWRLSDFYRDGHWRCLRDFYRLGPPAAVVAPYLMVAALQSPFGESAVELLLYAGVEPPSDALHIAARAGNTRSVCVLLQHGLPVDGLDLARETAFAVASRLGEVQVMHVLHTYHADVNSRQAGAMGQTALHVAVRNRRFTTVKVLRELGADPYVPDWNGRTPFDVLPSQTGNWDPLSIALRRN